MTSRRPSRRELEKALDELDGGDAGVGITPEEWFEWHSASIRASEAGEDRPTHEEWFGRRPTVNELALTTEWYAELVAMATSLDHAPE